MASDVPDEIVRATERGDTAAVRRWLADGGDPNQDIQSHAASGITYWHNFRLLLLATSNGRTGIVRLLLEHGADVNYVFQEPEPAEDSDDDEDDICDNFTALDVASTTERHSSTSYGSSWTTARSLASWLLPLC